MVGFKKPKSTLQGEWWATKTRYRPPTRKFKTIMNDKAKELINNLEQIYSEKHEYQIINLRHSQFGTTAFKKI